LAGATVVPVVVLVVGLALPLAVALVVGLALVVAVAVPDAGADTEAVGVGNVWWWCHHDEFARLSDPPLDATAAPTATAAATGMAIVAAMRARRLF
jgi:hypothetical protein